MSDYTSEQISKALADMQASGASNADIAKAAAAAGISPSEIAAATGVDVATINQVFQDSGVTPAPEPASTTAPVAPVTPAAPVAPAAPTTRAADLNQYNSQTQNGIKNAGLDSVMNSVVNGGNLTDLVKQGLTPQAIGQYKDASGKMLTAAPNTFMVSNPDGSGGALNYFFTVDPKTGTTAPINNPGQNLTYTPGSPGGFINGLVSEAGDIIKTVAPVALSLWLASEGIDPSLVGAITGATNSAVNGGSLTDIAKGAITGGVAGYAGGAAGDYLGNAGAGSTLASTGGGAAAGATYGLLTGTNPITGALRGGLAGAVISQIPMGNGQTQVKYDDGSQLTYDNRGLIVNGTDSSGVAIPATQITAANEGAGTGAPVEQKNFTSTDDIKNITDTISSMQADGASPTAIAKALQAQGYSAEQVISVTGNADAVNQAFTDATAATSTAAGNATGGLGNEDADFIAKTVKDMQDSGASANDIAKTLSKAGYTADQVIAVTGNPDAVNAAYATLNSGGVVTKVDTNTGTVTQTKVTNTNGTNTNGTNTNNGTNNTNVTDNTNVTNPSVVNTNTSHVIVPVIPTTPTKPTVVTPVAPTTTNPSTTTVPPLQMSGLVNPGLNPGWSVNGANQNFYNTNNPVQNTYYWGAHPYMMNQSDMASYNNVPGAPATPFGLQNLQHATGYDAQGKPVYPTASAPATQAAKGPGTLQQQLGAAWSAGNYGQVNNLVQQNQVTTNQAQSVFGFQPSDFAFAAAHGVNLIQPVAPSSTTTATTAASST